MIDEIAEAEAQKQHCAYYQQDGRIQFKSVLASGMEPPEIDGLKYVSVDHDFDPNSCAVIDGILVPGMPAPASSEDRNTLILKARVQRNQLIAASDWTQLPDSPISDSARADWAAYRQALRDLTNASDWPSTTWPTPPAA